MKSESFEEASRTRGIGRAMLIDVEVFPGLEQVQHSQLTLVRSETSSRSPDVGSLCGERRKRNLECSQVMNPCQSPEKEGT